MPSWRIALIGASILFVALAVARGLPEIRASATTIRDLHVFVAIAAMLLETAAVLALPNVYRAAARAVGARLRYRDALGVAMGAFSISRVVPGGGAAGALFAARRMASLGVAGPLAGLAVAIEGVVAMSTLGLVVVLITGGAGVRGTIQPIYVGLSAICLSGFVVALVVGRAALRSERFRHGAFAVIERIGGGHAPVGSWRAAADGVADAVPSGSALVPIVAWSAVNWLLDVGALWALFFGLGYALPLGVLLLGFAAANLLTALPHTPGGVGLVEVGMAGAYIALGVPPPVAIAGVLAYRLLAYWLPVAAGVPYYFRGRRPAAGSAAEMAAP